MSPFLINSGVQLNAYTRKEHHGLHSPTPLAHASTRFHSVVLTNASLSSVIPQTYCWLSLPHGNTGLISREQVLQYMFVERRVEEPGSWSDWQRWCRRAGRYRLRDSYFNGAVRLSPTISGNDQFGRVEQSAPGKQAAPKEKSKFGF